MLNLLLAEDHNIVRNGIKMLLETDETLNIVGEAVNGNEVLELLTEENDVDVVLADINMPELDGISLIKRVKAISPNTSVVMLSMHDNEKYISEAFLEGAAGYLLKNVSAEELIFAIKHVHAGEKYICSELAMVMLDKVIENGQQGARYKNLGIEFTLREIELLNLMAEGLTNNEMSEKLFLSKRTIEGHRQNLIDKTGAKNTASLIKFAIVNGIIH